MGAAIPESFQSIADLVEEPEEPIEDTPTHDEPLERGSERKLSIGKLNLNFGGNNEEDPALCRRRIFSQSDVEIKSPSLFEK